MTRRITHNLEARRKHNRSHIHGYRVRPQVSCGYTTGARNEAPACMCVVFDDQLDRYVTRCDTIRRVNYVGLDLHCDSILIKESLANGGDFTKRLYAAYGFLTGAIASAAIESKTRKSKQWFDSECYVMKRAVKKSYTEWRVTGDAASRDCHAENVASFHRD